MTTCNILFIENDQNDVKLVREIFEKYNSPGLTFKVYPDDKSFHKFGQALLRFGLERSTANLLGIKKKIEMFSFEIVLLDLHFLQGMSDYSGYLVRDEILDEHYPGVPLFYISSEKVDDPRYIKKAGRSELELELYEKIIRSVVTLAQEEQQTVLLTAQPVETTVETEQTTEQTVTTTAQTITTVERVVTTTEEPAQQQGHADEQPAQTTPPNAQQPKQPHKLNFDLENYQNSMNKRLDPPKSYLRISEWEKYTARPVVSFLLDSFIKYSLYICIGLLFLLAPWFLLHQMYHVYILRDSTNPLKIAENVFLIFLPFLIACGFFVFYIKSLSPHIKQEAFPADNFEQASNLLKLTKKLFVSSLLSFLFIRFIELLILEGDTAPVKPEFAKIYNTVNPLMQLYLVTGFMVILILYYIYIDRNHNPIATGARPKNPTG